MSESEHLQHDPYAYTHQPHGHATFPPKRKRRVWPALLIGVFVLIACAGGITALLANANAPGTIAVHTAPAGDIAEPPAKPEPAGKLQAKPATLAAGTWEVPGEVKPGTYTTTADGHCYWARLKDFDGELESIVANGNLDPGQRGRITVKKADKGLELTGDCVWKATK